VGLLPAWYRRTCRSADAMKRVFESVEIAMSSMTRSGDVWRRLQNLGRIQQANGLTTVFVHRPISKSHERSVQSQPTLNAPLLSERENKARDTRPVCDLSTEVGAFRFAVSSAPFVSEFAILRRFLCGSEAENTGAGTSSSEGISVVHSPMSLSHPAVNR
jgi:hypothetical protein